MNRWLKPLGTHTRDERIQLAIEALGIGYLFLLWGLRRHIVHGHG